jgi:hypothetical protein
MVNEYVPFGSVNDIDVVLPLYDSPFVRLMNQRVPGGRPVSLNVTTNLTSVNEMLIFNEEPFTVNDPEYGEGAYLLSTVAMVKEYDPFVS